MTPGAESSTIADSPTVAVSPTVIESTAVGRPPDPGSPPQVDQAGALDADVAGSVSSWLPGPEAGPGLFAAGLIALTISVGGLVTVAIRRRRY